MNATPSIKTTVVGSYPLPSWLAAYPSTPNLIDAIKVVLKTQELAGIDVIADGELYRFNVNHPETNGMIEYFIEPLGGIRSTFSLAEQQDFRQQERMSFRKKPAGVVDEKIGEGSLDLVSAWQTVSPLTPSPLKFTLTSPYMLACTLLDHHYSDIQALTMDIAEVLRGQVAQIGADVIQIDEAHLPGHPEDVDWVHQPINHILSAAQGEKAVHLCFGNYGGQTIQRGFWQAILPFLNALEVDHLVLEFARRGYDELEHFSDLRPEISLGIGVIDIKDNQVETPEKVARRIETAMKILGRERIRWVHPDCGFWMLPRSVADQKMTALVQGRDLVLGQ